MRNEHFVEFTLKKNGKCQNAKYENIIECKHCNVEKYKVITKQTMLGYRFHNAVVLHKTIFLSFCVHLCHRYLYIYISIYLYIYISIYLYIYIFAYLHIYISIYLYIYISIYLHIYISIYLYIYIFAYLHIYISIYLYICISTYLYIYISIYLYICISAYLYIYISIYLYIYISIYLHLNLFCPSCANSSLAYIKTQLQHASINKEELNEYITSTI